MRIVRLANFVGPRTGGIRTALERWGLAYARLGHDPVLIHPGDEFAHRRAEFGDVITLGGTDLPGRTGYQLVLNRRRVTSLLERLHPDAVEVSDRSSLRWVASWARRACVPSVMVSHECLTGVLQEFGAPPAVATRVADRLNTGTARSYDAIACPSSYAAQEFSRIGAEAHVVPLGVDHDVFTPAPTAGSPAPAAALRLLHCGRLSPEKDPTLPIRTLAELHRRGVPARLDVLGHGPMASHLRELARPYDVAFLPYTRSRAQVAGRLRAADVVIAPGPIETFGLAALEALACGTPVVCPTTGALPEVVGAGGLAAPSHAADFADAVLRLAADPLAPARARRRARELTWDTSARGMLQVHHAAAASIGSRTRDSAGG